MKPLRSTCSCSAWFRAFLKASRRAPLCDMNYVEQQCRLVGFEGIDFLCEPVRESCSSLFPVPSLPLSPSGEDAARQRAPPVVSRVFPPHRVYRDRLSCIVMGFRVLYIYRRTVILRRILAFVDPLRCSPSLTAGGTCHLPEQGSHPILARTHCGLRGEVAQPILPQVLIEIERFSERCFPM